MQEKVQVQEQEQVQAQVQVQVQAVVGVENAEPQYKVALTRAAQRMVNDGNDVWFEQENCRRGALALEQATPGHPPRRSPACFLPGLCAVLCACQARTSASLRAASFYYEQTHDRSTALHSDDSSCASSNLTSSKLGITTRVSNNITPIELNQVWCGQSVYVCVCV